jgi:hypothetical protein
VQTAHQHCSFEQPSDTFQGMQFCLVAVHWS